ncbi:uncharacterized protein LOC128860082 [Anastrepha ludens]|uniref:uncharacterized protein LOC128860082 n=1 Tax=Anastrepha ludens TaxID=28586 RepID=UPI0023AF87AB|nr:uncharacterized protein LOC128860082 [Anastrepha ludens]
MAKLNSVAAVGAGGTGDGLFAMLASVGVLLCMISTLIGIKIWWFKHRLTFDHNTTNNGAAGRATPTVPLRTRSSRDKRMSQQIREPVEIHGVFRRRQENDLDIVPTKQLPPVRIRKLSQSTPSLFPLPPPRRQENVRSALFEKFQPPTREPPRPPPESSPPLTPAISLVEEMPTFDELEQKYRQMELKEEKATELKADSHENILRVKEPPPQRLNRNSYNESKLVGMHKFVKSRPPATETESFQQKINERRATGYLRPNEGDINATLAGSESSLHEVNVKRPTSMEEFGERRPTGYIKYEEIDVHGLEDFREKWERLQTSLGAERTITYQNSERMEYEKSHGHIYDHINRASDRDSYKVAPITEPTPLAEESCKLGREERLNWGKDESVEDKRGTPESLGSIDFTSDEEYADELDGVKRKKIFKSTSVANYSFNSYQAVENVRPQPLEEPSVQQGTLKFGNTLLEETGVTNDAAKENPILRRQAGHMRAVQPEQVWDELEANIKQDEHEKHLWLEIEKDLDLNRDLVSNIEEEFDKIRHSYEENEAAFLENSGGLRRVPKKVLITTPEPDGFGKSIDEDWESFENLVEEKPKILTEASKNVVQFNLSDLEDAYDKESTLRIERRPTSFIHNRVQFKRELSNIEDADEPTSPLSNASCIELVEKDQECYATPTYEKEHRPTGYAHLEITDLDDDYVREHNKNNIFEPVEEPLTVKIQPRARPRPRQKVTFDFSNTEYFQASNGEEDTEDDEETDEREAAADFSKTTWPDNDLAEEDVASQTIPKPMQRVTKIHYAAELYNDESSATEEQIRLAPSPTLSPAPVTLLFGTQTSSDTAEVNMNNSWATTPPKSMSPTLLNKDEHPKPAYRNTVTKTSMVKSLTVVENQQYTSMNSFKPLATARKQYFEESNYNSTEA